MLSTPQLSDTMAEKLSNAKHSPSSLEYGLAGSGKVTTGASLSSTTTVKLQVAVLSEPSVTVQMTLVAPSGKMASLIEPESLKSLVTDATEQLSSVEGSRLVSGTVHVHTP